jgi:hypothetical protein
VIYTGLHDGMKGQALPLKFCLDIIDRYSVQPLRGDDNRPDLAVIYIKPILHVFRSSMTDAVPTAYYTQRLADRAEFVCLIRDVHFAVFKSSFSKQLVAMCTANNVFFQRFVTIFSFPRCR